MPITTVKPCPSLYQVTSRSTNLYQNLSKCRVSLVLYEKDYRLCKATIFNSLPNDKIWDVTKLKAFADNKLNIDEMMISLLDRVENTEGKRENADYQHFLLFQECFPKTSSLGSLKVRIVW